MEQSTRDNRQPEPEKEEVAEKETEVSPVQASSSTLGEKSRLGDLPAVAAEDTARTRSIASQGSRRPGSVKAESVYEGNPYDVDRVNTRESFKD